MLGLLLGVGLGLVAEAWALPPAPAPLAMTAAEETTLSQGGIVFRYNPTGESIGVVDVAAAPAATMAAVLDLAPRVQDVSALRAYEGYGEGPGRKGARWELGASLYSATFHILYEYDIAAGWCVYRLDTSKENDIKSSTGSYQVYPNAQGGSRVVYRSAQQSSVLPSWVMEKFAGEGAQQLLAGIRRRAER